MAFLERVKGFRTTLGWGTKDNPPPKKRLIEEGEKSTNPATASSDKSQEKVKLKSSAKENEWGREERNVKYVEKLEKPTFYVLSGSYMGSLTFQNINKNMFREQI